MSSRYRKKWRRMVLYGQKKRRALGCTCSLEQWYYYGHRYDCPLAEKS